jgi:excinuclease ABC subunit B
MLREVGYCTGIENYSRHFSNKGPGEPPDTLLSYFPKDKNGSPDFLTVIDESHVTLPQLQGMYAGDASRKKTLIEHGFRLPSAADNRPLKFEEFLERVGQVLFTSATPAHYELENSTVVANQIIRPTGLIDPKLIVKKALPSSKYPGQVADFIDESIAAIKKGERVIATTLTKKMAEDLSSYLKERGIKAEYLHSDIKTIDRITILTDFRRGKFDCLVGVNLLREGLDLPEVALIGILDADKEGFLRSETSLIQIIGRAARNINGRVILYADKETKALNYAISVTNDRRSIQVKYNEEHGITPKTISKNIHDIAEEIVKERQKIAKQDILLELRNKDKNKLIKEKEKLMNMAVKDLDFESAAIYRDEIKALKDN